MAKDKKAKQTEKRPELKDKDNPSLVEVGDKLCLRVFEDFFVEKELPKWKNFEAQRRAFLKELGLSIDYWDSFSLKERMEKFSKEHPEEAKQVSEEYARLKKMYDMVNDDRWNIKGKHEQEVDEAIKKTVVYMGYRPKTLRGKVRAWLGKFRKKDEFKPVEIAFEDLKDNMVITSSEQLMQAKGQLDILIEGYRKAGQYGKVETAKKLVPQLAHELAIAKMGYTKYVTESQMIDFVKKSERGVMVDFLRYYDGTIPPEVVNRKSETDEKMVFDNYVIAYYCDLKKKAKVTEEKKKEEKKEKATVRRRDPILFGVVKQTRKLYYICDWITPEDDLTLDKLEQVLGDSAKVLFQRDADDSTASTYDPTTDTNARTSVSIYHDSGTMATDNLTWTDSTANSRNMVYYALEDAHNRIQDLEDRVFRHSNN